ncbi:class I SAM-dependent methyltransferase [Candidatus Saccharibacteria bacterium]|nr:class I SAM-dependent methyltransferase [Candidatus Saccharibacteria bacterium]
MENALSFVSVNEEARLQYEKGSTYADARRKLYEFAIDKRDLWSEMAKRLEIKQGDLIVDAGTGNGAFPELLDKRVSHDFRGQFDGLIVGLDKYPQNFAETRTRIGATSIDTRTLFIDGDVENLIFPPKSVDTFSLNFLLYHVDDPIKVLDSAKDALVEGGQLLVSTRGTRNQQRLWHYGDLIADRLGSTRPESFYSQFDIATCREELGKLFHIEEEAKPQAGHLAIPLDLDKPNDNRGWSIYRDAILGLVLMMRNKNTGLPVDEAQALAIIDGEIREEFTREAKNMRAFTSSSAYFMEQVDQTYFVCRNSK